MNKKINWWAVLAVVIIGGFVGFAVMGVLNKISPEPEPAPKPESFFLTVSTSSIELESQAGSEAVTIESNTQWEVVMDDGQDWLTASPINGQDSAKVTFVVDENTDTIERQATVRVMWTDENKKDKEETVIITQRAKAVEQHPVPPVPDPVPPTPDKPYLKVSSNGKIAFSERGGRNSFDIRSNTDWKATVISGGDWLTIGNVSGRGSGSVSLTAKANTSDSQRKATVSVTWKDDSGKEQTAIVNVTQKGVTPPPPPPTPYVKVSPAAVKFAHGGGTNAITVKSNTEWETADSNADWLKVNVAKGTGNKSITVTATKNASTTEREATMTFSWKDLQGTSKSTVVTVKQAGATPPPPPPTPYVTVTPSGGTIAANGGKNTITVKSNTSWSVTSDADWLKENINQETGNKQVVVTAEKNNTDKERTAKLTFTWTDGQGAKQTKTVSVKQAKPAPKPITKEEAQQIVSAGKADARVPDNCTIVGNGVNTTYGRFRSDVASGKYASVQVTAVNATDKANGNATKISVKVTNPPPEVLTKEKAQTIVRAGIKSDKVPDECTIVMDGRTMNYQTFRNGVRLNTYSSVEVLDGIKCDAQGKATLIKVKAKVTKEE